MPPYDESVSGARNRIEGWTAAPPSRTPAIHNRMHVWVGGDMITATSPNDPVFFLHHANVDRIWSAWSQTHPDSAYRPLQSDQEELQFHRIDDPMHTFFQEQVTARMVLDHSPLYTYDTLDDLLP